MFISYEYIKYLGYDKTTNLYRDEYKIIDTDFEAPAFAVEVGVEVGVAVGVDVAVIETYRKRNLPVVPNLFRCMQYTSSKYSYWTIEKQIEYHRKHNPYWSEYEDEINKYLLLL